MEWAMNTAALISNDWFFLLLIALVFWSVDKHLSIKLLIIFALSTYTNHFLHHTIPTPSSDAVSSVLPPKDVQIATAFWGFLIPEISDKRYTLLACLLIAALSFTEMQYGGYSVQDVIVAILLGSFFVYLIYRSDWISSVPQPIIFSFTMVIPSALLLLFPEGAYYAGLLLGGGIGYNMELIKNRMQFATVMWKRGITCIIGISGLFVIAYLNIFFAPTTLFSFVHAILIGLWLTLLLPILSVKTGLYRQSHVTKHLMH
ncbi:hypothetical protein SAMN05192534_106130 [Alteribacillus persepolensis]|uniref:Uncharacterized protein n=1 Tax=Alteribacillus persepolensis TaxID=568899 RepID=A0A1G8CZM1_9BACI|nr:hypothetical protein [Alteribacillus persepolensis]SDH50579.1 hypothetical protein SAMN05192534_106130 [Alteribacillus persepolensis]